MSDEPVCSRRPASPLIGTMDDQIPAFRISGETKLVLTRRATAIGLNLTEYVRMVLDVHAHGPDEVRKVQELRLGVAAGLFGEPNGHGGNP